MRSAENNPPGAIAWIDKILKDAWVHPSFIERSSLERLRSKMLVLLGTLLTLLGPLVASGYFRNDEPAYGIAFILFGVLGVGTILSIRFLGSVVLSCHLGSLALLMATVTGSYALGGAGSMAIRWFAAVPVLAAVFGGLRAGIGWLALSWGMFAAMLFAPEFGVVFPEPSEVGADKAHQLITMSTFMFTTLMLFLIGEMIGTWLLYEKNRAQESLQSALDEAVAASAAKSRFLAMMSHELRTPLNAIIGYSELLVEEMEHDNNEDYIDDAMAIRSSGRHLLSLISDILDVTMLDSGRVELRPEEIAIEDFVDEVAKTARALSQERGNTFTMTLDAELIGAVLSTDVSKLRQVLFNLLGNAAKFTEEGRILLRITPLGEDMICFQVADTGIGLAPEEQERVWDEFVQADDSSTREHGGVGLGLALVRKLARLLGGDVSLESVLGKGSVFTVVVPRTLSAP
jgi:signal transduction histidine kinase